MEIRKVWALYYSATGTTDKAVNTIAEELAAKLDLPCLLYTSDAADE